MKQFLKSIMFVIILVFFIGCSIDKYDEIEKTTNISDVDELVLNENDLLKLGFKKNSECKIENYNTSEFSPLKQYAFCNYTIEKLNNTKIIIEFKKYTNLHDLNGTYQYSSSHLFSSEGLISKDNYGDQSVFRVNSEKDYGGEFNEENVHYYHLWFTNDLFLIHITSKGSIEAKEYIEKIANKILLKFKN
ncbi:MAG: hypothetical protein ACLFPJ_02415 [Candidatus Woesearchaeota archaeon]